MAPERLDDALELADICDGRVPYWLRNRDGPVEAADAAPLGATFEAALDEAEVAAAERPARQECDDDDPA